MRKFIVFFSIAQLITSVSFAEECAAFQSSASACGIACGYDLICNGSKTILSGTVATAILSSHQTDTEDQEITP